MRRSNTFLLILLLAAMAGGVGSLALAQNQSPISVTIEAGYDSAYRAGDWYPIVIDIANDGPDVDGILEWSYPAQHDEPVFHQAIELPRGSRKRVTMEVFTRGFARSGQLQLLDNGVSLFRQDVRIDTIDDTRLLIGVISSDPALLNSLNALRIGVLDNPDVRHFDIGTLPEQAVTLRAVNVLFLHDVDSSTLNQPQRDALAMWVQSGGQLVVSGGIGGQKTAAGLGDLLPVESVDTVVQGDLAPLASFSQKSLPQTGAMPINQVRARPEAELFPANAPLLFRRDYGLGKVTFTAFDIANLRGWAGEPEMWGQLIAPLSTFVPGVAARQNRLNLLQNVLQLPTLGLPSAGALFCFLLGYIVVIGPLNYLLLRRLRRLEWAWVSVPLVVLLFAGGLYVVGIVLRGGQSQLNQVTVVQAIEGQPRGLATAFVGLFSPGRASYTLSFADGVVLNEVRGWNDGGAEEMPVLAGDSGVEAHDVLVDVASVRTFAAETSVDVPLSVQSSLGNGSGQVNLRNTGQTTLEDALIVYEDAFQPIGTLAPGANVSFRIDGTQRNFPWAVSLSGAGLFNRQQMLNTLFTSDVYRMRNMNRPTTGIDQPGMYLIAWISQPTVPVRVNGQEASQQGLTLYVVRLREPIPNLPQAYPPPFPTPAPAGVFTPSPIPTP